jgi:hypothetical protein
VTGPGISPIPSSQVTASQGGSGPLPFNPAAPNQAIPPAAATPTSQPGQPTSASSTSSPPGQVQSGQGLASPGDFYQPSTTLTDTAPPSLSDYLTTQATTGANATPYLGNQFLNAYQTVLNYIKGEF